MFVIEYQVFLGAHEYKYLVDGKWVVDDHQTKIDNKLGGENNIINIDEADFEVCDFVPFPWSFHPLTVSLSGFRCLGSRPRVIERRRTHAEDQWRRQWRPHGYANIDLGDL